MTPLPWTSKHSFLVVAVMVLLITTFGSASAQGSDPPPSTPVLHSDSIGTPPPPPGTRETPAPPVVPVPSGKDPYWREPQAPSGGLPLLPPTVVLYDQYNNAGVDWISSQDFESAMNTYDDMAADDFVVPAGAQWTITEIEVDGQYNGSGPASAVNVLFLSDLGGVPGSVVEGRGGLPVVAGPGAGDFVISLPPVVLIPGTYWVSVQAVQDFSPNGQWGWTDRTVLSNNRAVFQNPGDGFTSGCTTWSYRSTTCGLTPGEPDQVFRLSGTVQRHNVLYDQYNFPQSTGTSSQDFEAGYNSFDDQAADDFVVPVGESWTITQVEVDGQYWGGAGPVAAVNVFIYGGVSGFPYPIVAARTGLLPYWGPQPGDLVIPITPVTVGSGSYWVSVQAVMDYATGGQWGWSDRTSTSHNAAMWQNPDDGFGTGCFTWGWRGSACGIDPSAPDQVYRLIGVRSVFLPLTMR
jgi:hypothetical protein